MLNVARAAGISDEDILDLLRVLGRGLSQAAESMRALPLKLVLEPGLSERDLALPLRARDRAAVPARRPARQQHARRCTCATRRRARSISALERSGGQLPGSREVVVCFADLVGFTRLGEEVPPDELGRLAVRLEALATDVAEPPVRLVKTIGDAAMLASAEPEPLLEAALRLIDAADAEGEDFPQLRAGAALGLGAAARRRLVRAPGQPRQPHHLDRAPGQPARRARGARVAAEDAYRWSFAGRAAPARHPRTGPAVPRAATRRR